MDGGKLADDVSGDLARTQTEGERKLSVARGQPHHLSFPIIILRIRVFSLQGLALASTMDGGRHLRGRVVQTNRPKTEFDAR